MAKKAVKKSVKKTAKKVTGNARAGRPQGSGKFGCATKLVRIPIHLEKEVVEFALQKVKSPKSV
jgi:hypothetical protein